MEETVKELVTNMSDWPRVVETREAVSPIIDDSKFGEEMNPAVAVNRVRPPVVETRDAVSPIIEESRLGDEMKPAVKKPPCIFAVVEIREAVDTYPKVPRPVILEFRFIVER